MCRLVLVVAVLPFTACAPLAFSTEVKGETVVLGNAMQPTLNVFPAIGGMNDLDFNANREFLNASVKRENVSAVSVQSVTVKILTPENQDFSFLESLQLVAQATDNSAVFAEKLDIRTLDLTAPTPTLTMDVKPVDLAPYVTAPIMSIVMRGKGKTPVGDTRLEVKVKLFVSASAKRQ